MESVMFRWGPSFDFFWPHLKLLHTPPSKYHWIKAMQALEASKSAESPVVPCLIIAAARFGLARIENCPALAAIALNGIIDPVTNDEWFDLCTKDAEFLDQYIKDQSKKLTDKGYQFWRPARNEVPIADLLNLQMLGNEDEGAVPPGYEDVYKLEQRRVSAMNYLDYLREEHDKRIRSQIDRENSGIKLKSLPFDHIDETDLECSICSDHYTDIEIFYQQLREAAQQEPALAKMEISMSYPRELDSWPLKLELHHLSVQTVPDHWDTIVMKEIMHFIYGLILGHYRWIDLHRSQNGCKGPVKLFCGHVFGFYCIAKWLEDSPNCPHCRVDVRTKSHIDPDEAVVSIGGVIPAMREVRERRTAIGVLGAFPPR